eukprot:COSAG01_NODE_3694_length_5787_cov_18.116913_2_plen_72_part_00
MHNHSCCRHQRRHDQHKGGLDNYGCCSSSSGGGRVGGGITNNDNDPQLLPVGYWMSWRIAVVPMQVRQVDS